MFVCVDVNVDAYVCGCAVRVCVGVAWCVYARVCVSMCAYIHVCGCVYILCLDTQLGD